MADVTVKPKINRKHLVGVGGIITAFTTVVFAYIDSKTSGLDKRIEDKYYMTKDYVDAKHGEVKDKLDDIQKILVRIDDRIYQLNKHKGE